MHTTQVEINGFTITLPIGLEQVMDTPVRDSYQDFLKSDTKLVRRHLTALTTMLPKYLYRPSKVLHVFGGVGATAQVIDQTCVRNGWDTPSHEFWERDPVLVKYLNEAFPQHKTLLVKDSFALLPNVDLAPYDHIMFDPSVATIKTKGIKNCWTAMRDAHPHLIWLSDTACAKIHINAQYYEKDFHADVVPTAEGYLKAYDHWLRNKHSLNIVDAMREAAETYCVVQPLDVRAQRFPNPIPYM